jgi:hypothetical protein
MPLSLPSCKTLKTWETAQNWKWSRCPPKRMAGPALGGDINAQAKFIAGLFQVPA